MKRRTRQDIKQSVKQDAKQDLKQGVKQDAKQDLKQALKQDAKHHMKKRVLKTRISYSIFFIAVVMGGMIFSATTEARAEEKQAASSSYTVKPDSKPYQNKWINHGNYNSQTKDYFLLRSYLEELEKEGGGTLTLQAGTYRICNTLYVSSHVTINFEDGVIIKKTNQSGTTSMPSSSSIFQLVGQSKSKIEKAYGGYEGEKDIQFIGNGEVIIDLDYKKDALGIVLGHNDGVSISGITFQNMNSGHFIELDASKNVIIENNTFRNHKASYSGRKEAINLDTPDKNTGGFNFVWTKYDCTPNKDVIIRNNGFSNLERAIGTHKYSEGKYHENIQLLDNTIENMDSDAIRIMNWKAPIINGNKIKKVADGRGTDRAILASGVIHPVITENTFEDVPRPIQIMPWKNNGSGKDSEYEITYNIVDETDIESMLKNNLIRAGEHFIRINKTYNQFIRDTEKRRFSSKYIRR